MTKKNAKIRKSNRAKVKNGRNVLKRKIHILEMNLRAARERISAWENRNALKLIMTTPQNAKAMEMFPGFLHVSQYATPIHPLPGEVGTMTRGNDVVRVLIPTTDFMYVGNRLTGQQ